MDAFAGAISATAGAVVSVEPVTSVTVRSNAVVRVRPEILALMVIVDVPGGVDADVEMMTVVVHVGEQDAALKVATAPGGSPDAVKGTGFGVPATRRAATAFDTDDPRATD
ncbi:MAG TPA: hypothetical protein VGJ78_05435 [Vicinamibacterales bacterium]|jgi:hypothetical protein